METEDKMKWSKTPILFFPQKKIPNPNNQPQSSVLLL